MEAAAAMAVADAMAVVADTTAVVATAVVATVVAATAEGADPSMGSGG
jgi:hypothetical protein